MTHTQLELNVPRLAAGAFTQLDLQDILTAPEYFLVPLAGAPTTLDDVTQVSEAEGQDAVLPLGNRANFTDSGYSFYPGPRSGIRRGAVEPMVLRGIARGVACRSCCWLLAPRRR